MKENIECSFHEYLERFPAEHTELSILSDLLENGADITSRKEFRGHVTCSGVVVNSERRLLMIHHKTLNKWLFPGGHLERNDGTLRQAAQREICEETGMDVHLLNKFGQWFDDIPIHIDCHPIPKNDKKDEPEHSHIDFRYVFQGNLETANLQLDEVTDWAWAEVKQAPIAIQKRLSTLGLV
ncbi:MAG: NUDIX domain-containing protein [Pseudomonadota bacterium]